MTFHASFNEGECQSQAHYTSTHHAVMSDGGGTGDRVQVLRSADGPELALVAHGGSARAVVWPGVGAEHRSMHRVSLDGGGSTIEISHDSEAVYLVFVGSATVIDRSDDVCYELITGSMIHIDPNTTYQFEAGPSGAELVGGPCPPDPRLYPS